MRGVKRLVGGEEEGVYALSRRRLEQNLQEHRSVDDDQRFFLSARTATAGEGCGRTG
jgi:hypothetical protein